MIAFSELMAIDSGHHKWNLSLYDTGRYMRLDAAAQRALNVMKQRTDANDTFSLYGLMNKGRTPMAKRLLKVLSLTCPSACSGIPPLSGIESAVLPADCPRSWLLPLVCSQGLCSDCYCEAAAGNDWRHYNCCSCAMVITARSWNMYQGSQRQW